MTVWKVVTRTMTYLQCEVAPPMEMLGDYLYEDLYGVSVSQDVLTAIVEVQAGTRESWRRLSNGYEILIEATVATIQHQFLEKESIRVPLADLAAIVTDWKKRLEDEERENLS